MPALTVTDDRLLDVVRAIDACQRVNLAEFADAWLVRHGYTEGQADRLLERAAYCDLIEYGVSARTGWLTPKGERMLHDGSSTARP